jgi:hypothetical protein
VASPVLRLPAGLPGSHSELSIGSIVTAGMIQLDVTTLHPLAESNSLRLGYGTVPRGTTHWTGWPVILAISS